MAEFDPSKPSAAFNAMSSHWRTVRDVLGGVETMRAAGTRYLPQLPRESDKDYRYRLQASPFVNLYLDLVSALTSKPFSNEIAVGDGTPEPIVQLAEDIDGQGNNLHTFAERLFFNAVNDAICWLLIDMPAGAAPQTIAEEQRSGRKPYWVMLEAPSVLSVKFAQIGGRQEVVEARISETETVDDGNGGERTADRVRILQRLRTGNGEYAPATWELWEKQQALPGRAATWQLIDGGPISIGVVPLVPVLAGRQAGARLVAVLADCLQLQVEHWQRESALKHARTMTSFPILTASGVEPPSDGSQIEVGPSRVLFAPSTGDGKAASWQFIEPAATSLKFLAEDIERLEGQMRELGRQPLTAQTGNITVVAANFAASKANSVIEALSLNLKDALEMAFIFTAMWLGIEASVNVNISTDFDTGLLDASGADTLLKLRENNDLSQRTLWAEMRRRNILSPEFDPDKEEEQILADDTARVFPDNLN